MDKKDIVRVNEDLMRGIMTGDIPASRLDEALLGESQQKSEEPSAETHNVRAPEPSAAKPVVRRKRREEPRGYEARFLAADNATNRVTVKIDRELFRRFRSLLSVIAPELSLVSYLNNILTDHLEAYSDEISEIFDSKFEKPI